MKKYFYLTLLLLLFCANLEARIFIDIDSPSGQKLPIALVPLKILDPKVNNEERFDKQFQVILERDLRMTGLFQILNRQTFLESPESGIALTETNFSLWKKTGADALVKGGISKQNDTFALELRLFDVQQQTSIIGKKYFFQAAEFPQVVHAFADQVILKLTGQSGVFSTTKIACVGTVRKSKEIFEMAVDGGKLNQLTHHRSLSLAPSWSRDGEYLAYTSYKVRNPDLYLLNRKTLAEKSISSRPGLNFSASFSPVKDLIALAISNNSDQEIVIIDYKGRTQETLTNNWWIDIEPTWSPDGKMLAFVSSQSGQPHIYRSHADGSGLTRLTYAGYHNVNPDWSPRSDKIAFAGRDEGTFDIFIMNTDGSNIQRLTRGSRNNENPAWSPNGQMIAFSSDRSGKSQIYVMGADGSGQTQITDGISPFSHPAWSPWLK